MVLNWPIESVGTERRNGSSGSPDIMGHRSVRSVRGMELGRRGSCCKCQSTLSSGRILIVNNDETHLGATGPMRRAVDEVVVDPLPSNFPVAMQTPSRESSRHQAGGGWVLLKRRGSIMHPPSTMTTV